MSMSTSRSLLGCSVLTCLAVLSACSDNDAANVSFEDTDRSNLPTNVVPNGDLSASSTEWTGWSTGLDDTRGAQATFSLESFPGSQGGSTLRVDVQNAEKIVDDEGIESFEFVGDIHAGPASVPVTPGRAYGVGAFVQGPRCAKAQFAVHAAGDPETVLAQEEFFFSGAPQSVDYFFEVPEDGPSSVDLPVQLAYTDNIDGSILLDRFVAIPTVMPEEKEAGNDVYNSSFELSESTINNIPELGEKEHQNPWSNRGDAATFSLDTSEAQDGEKSVKIEFGENVGTGNPWDIEGGVSDVTVTDGFTYTLSLWVKGDDGARANFIVQKPSPDYDSYDDEGGNSGLVTITPEWQEVRFAATVTGTDVVRLYAQYNYPENANKTIYVDNVRLIPPDTCPYSSSEGNRVSDNEELFEYDHVSNGSLEESNTEYTGWNTAVAGSAQAEFQVSNGLSNSGDNALKTTITAVGEAPSDIQVGPDGLIVEPGQTYIYSAFVRPAPGSQLDFNVALQDSPFTVFEGQTMTFNDSLWRQITFDFTVPADAPTLTEEQLTAAGLSSDAVVTRIHMPVNMSYPTNAGRSFFLDDFTLLPNAVVNGDLENSDTEAEGWWWQAEGDVASFALDSSEEVGAHTGSNALAVEISEIAADATITPENIQAGVTNISVAGGRTYYVSTRIKGEEGAQARVALGLVDEEFGASGAVELSADWQEVTFAVQIPEGVDTVRLLAQLGYVENSNATIYLDTFRVVSQIPPPPPAESANIVTNGGLEAGTTNGWVNSGAAVIAVTQSADGVHSGNFGLHVTERTEAWNSAQQSLLDVGLENGGRYMASAWVKVDGETADKLTMTLLITDDAGNDEFITISSTGEADTLGWTRLSGYFDYAPTGNVADVRVYIEAEEAETSYFIDDLFITKVFTPNGDLELGDSTGWNGAGDAQIVASMDDSHSGAYSLHVSGRTEPWNSAQYDLMSSGMEPGRTYQVSAWVKVDGETADNLKMTVEVQDDDNDTNQYLQLDQASETLEWVKLSSQYTFAPDGEPTVFKVYFEADLAETNYYVDDLVITEVIPPVNLISNGGFELGRTDGWIGNGDAALDVTQSAEGVYSGNFGVHVTGRTVGWHAPHYGLMEAGLEEGVSYMGSAWVKVDGDTADNLKLTLQVSYDTAETQYINISEFTEVTDAGWTQLIGMVTYSPVDTVTDVSVYVEAEGAETAYYVDELVIKQVYTQNGNLEASDTDPVGWNASGDAQLSLTTEEVHSGTQALYVSGRTVAWNSAQYDLLNSGMEPGKTYDISAWVKIEGEVADTIRMTIEKVDEGDNTYQYLTIADSSETLTWVKLSSTYTYAPEGTATTFKVYFEAAGDTSAYYIDDLVITEASESYSY